MNTLQYEMRNASELPIFTDPVGAYPVRFDTLGQKIAFWREKYRYGVANRQLTTVKKALWHLEMLANYWNRFVPSMGDAIDTNPAVRTGAVNLDGTPINETMLFYVDKFGEPAMAVSPDVPGSSPSTLRRMSRHNARIPQRERAAAQDGLLSAAAYAHLNRVAAKRFQELVFPNPPSNQTFD